MNTHNIEVLKQIKSISEEITEKENLIKTLRENLFKELSDNHKFNINDIIKGEEYKRFNFNDKIKTKIIIVEDFELRIKNEKEVFIVAIGHTATKFYDREKNVKFNKNWNSKRIEIILNDKTKLLSVYN